jgi:hypothetical protein
VRLEGRRAVGADDAQVRESIVIRDAIDVVEDQSERPAAPHLPLTADLTTPLLDPLGEKPAFEVTAVIGGVFDEKFGQRCRRAVQRLASYRLGVEVVRADPPERDVLLDRPVVAARRAKADLAQCFAVRPRVRHRIS